MSFNPIPLHQLLLWDPHPPLEDGTLAVQDQAWRSNASIIVITGANRSGKSALLCQIVASYVLPHPKEPGYAYWPCVPERHLPPEQVYYGPETLRLRNGGRSIPDPHYHGDGLPPRVMFPNRVQLPTVVWLVEPTMLAHRDVALNYLPPLLEGHISKTVKSETPNIPSVYYLDNGSEIHLRSAAMGLGGFQRAKIHLLVADEPFPQKLLGEMLARLVDFHGRFIMGATVPGNDADTEQVASWNWIVENFVERHKAGTLPENTDYFNMTMKENPTVSYHYASELLWPVSDAERASRLDGVPELFKGNMFHDKAQLDYIKRNQLRDPVLEGYLKWNEDLNDWDVLTPEPEDTQINYRVWQTPEKGRHIYIGCDPSGGASDPTSIRVWGENPYALLCCARGWIPLEYITYEIWKLSQWYGCGVIKPNMARKVLENVILNVETNKGMIIINDLLYGHSEKGVLPPLPQLYYAPSPTDLDQGRHNPGKKPGWETMGHNRRYLDDAANRIIHDAVLGLADFPDELGLEERYWYVYDNRGRPRATTHRVNGQVMHDDTIDADSLSYMIKIQAPLQTRAEARSSEKSPYRFQDGRVRVDGWQMILNQIQHQDRSVTRYG